MGTVGSCLGVKRPGREADHCPPSSAVKNGGVISPLPHTSSWRGAYSMTAVPLLLPWMKMYYFMTSLSTERLALWFLDIKQVREFLDDFQVKRLTPFSEFGLNERVTGPSNCCHLKLQVTCTPLVGTHIRRGHKHGRRKWKIARERRILSSNKCILLWTTIMQ
jgi:hypothetical protein